MLYDIEYAYLDATPSFVRKRNYEDAKEIIEQNIDKIFDEYFSIDASFEEEREIAKKSFEERKAQFEKKMCACGHSLRYVQGYDFWGCKNFNAPGGHTKFSGLDPIIYEYSPSFNRIWLTNILKAVGIHGEVNTKELYQWLIIENQYPDLYLKYTGKSSEETFNGYVKTRLRSQNQELDALSYFTKIYDKVIYQQCIRYKLRGKKETFCIPDFICSIAHDVHVIDCKLDYCKDEKMHLYVQLVSVVMRSRNDFRSIKGFHVLQEEEIESEFGFIKLPKQY